MDCPKCGYVMDAFTEECPRCKRLGASAAIKRNTQETIGQQPAVPENNPQEAKVIDITGNINNVQQKPANQESYDTDAGNQPQKKVQITENKSTCSACGHIWFWGLSEITENISATTDNCMKGTCCCLGCLPAIFIPDKKVVDMGKCPKCGSRAVRQEKVTHDV